MFLFSKAKCEIVSIVKSYWKPVLILTAIYCFGLIAIFRANFDYIDDMARITEGYRNWYCFSRYLSDFLAAFIHTSTYLTDISPLPQILACLFMAIAGIILICTFNNNFKISVWNYIAAITLALNPYFLECVSYKFDAPYMALSILGSVFPIVFYKSKPIIYYLSIFIGTLVMCTTYQAACGVFPVLLILYSLKLWNNKESTVSILKKAGLSTLVFIASLLFFKLFLANSWEDYVETTIPTISKFIPTYFSNLLSYYSYVFSDLKKSWLLVIALVVLTNIFVVAYTSRQNKLLSIVLSVVSLMICFVICFGAYPVFVNPLFAPRAMYGFTTLIAVLCIAISTTSTFSFLNIPVICLSWIFLVFSFTYGNALSHQKEYSDYRIEAVINSLNSLDEFNQENCIVQISGTAGYCPSIAKGSKEYNILKRLVPLTFTEYWYHGNYRFYNYYGLKIGRNDNINMIPSNYPVLLDTSLHTIKGSGNNFLVILK